MKLKGWKDITPGGTVTEPGSSKNFKTGSWRTLKPKFIEENCIQCLYCWLFCPDMAVTVENGKMTGFDFEFCKGCGICALECPGKKGNKAIVMEEEGK